MGRVGQGLRGQIPGNPDEVSLHPVNEHRHPGGNDVLVFPILGIHHDIGQQFLVLQKQRLDLRERTLFLPLCFQVLLLLHTAFHFKIILPTFPITTWIYSFFVVDRRAKFVVDLQRLLCIIKMSASFMFDQSCPSSKGHPRKQIKLLHTYKDLNSVDELQIFKRFLHSLTFDLQITSSDSNLEKEEVCRLKMIIDVLYQNYKEKKCLLSQIEGIWPLLTFLFVQTSGLELYMQFQRLVEPSSQPIILDGSAMIKQEYLEFDPKGYFNTANSWLKDKNFMRILRVLERPLNKKSLEEALLQTKKMFRVLIDDPTELLMQSKQFEVKLELFRMEYRQLVKEKALLKQMRVRQMMEANRLTSNVVSDPGDMNNVLKCFSREEYIINQSYQHYELVPQLNGCRTVVNMPTQNILEQLSCGQSLNRSKKREVTYYNSSPTKRRLPPSGVLYGENKSTPKRNRVVQIPQRYKFIDRLYEIEPRKNLVFEEMQQQRKRQGHRMDKSNKIDKCVKNRLKKISRIQFYSDEEKKQKRLVKREGMRQVENSQKESSSQSEWDKQARPMQLESSEQIQVRRMRPTKNRIIRPMSDHQLNLPRGNIQEQSYSFNFTGNGSQSDSNLPPLARQKKVLLSAYEDDLKGKKQNPFSQYLRGVRELRQYNPLQSLQGIQIRRLELGDSQQLLMRIDLNEYLQYLSMLEPKQIRKQVRDVSKQLLARQTSVVDIDMTLKVLSLYAKSACTESSPNWSTYLYTFIEPMLRHCLTVNLYAGISQVLNNLSVSSFNEDLSVITRIKMWFKCILEIAGACSSNNNLQSNILQIIYQELTTPSKMPILLSEDSSLGMISSINLENPYRIGAKRLKFTLTAQDTLIGFIVGSFIFQELVLLEVMSDKQVLGNISDRYLKRLTKELSQLKQTYFQNKQFYTLTASIRKFYSAYTPSLSRKQYFINMVHLINVSLARLNADSALQNPIDTEIGDHLQFIQAVFGDYISMVLSKDFYNPLNLMNIITVRTNIKEYKEISPSCKLTMTIYPRVLTLCWNHQAIRNNQVLYNSIISKYLATLKSGLFVNGQSILIISDFLVAQSIYNFILAVYRGRMASTLSLDYKFTLNPHLKGMQRFTDTKEVFGQVREIVVGVFKELDQQFDISMRYIVNKAGQDNSRQKIRFESIERIIINFLNLFIHPLCNQDSSEDESVLSYSISHYLFGLQFVLHFNCFLRYFKLKLPFQSNTHSQLLKKCQSILDYYFGRTPNFAIILDKQLKDLDIFQYTSEGQRMLQRIERKQQYLKLYFTIIWQYYQGRLNFSPQNTMLRQVEIVVLKELTERQSVDTLANIFSMYILAGLNMINQSIVSHQDNPLYRFMVESTGVNTIASNKIEKAVRLINSVLRQMTAYCQSRQPQRGSLPALQMMIDHFLTNFILKAIREITTAILVGFTLRDRHQFRQIPLQELQRHLSQLKWISVGKSQHDKETGYLHFLIAFQHPQAQCSLSSVFDAYFHLFGVESRAGQGMARMLIEVQQPMRRLMTLEQDKSPLVAVCLQILTFALSLPEVSAECIKKYLHEMQLVSRGQSLLGRLDITGLNVLRLLRLLMAVEMCRYDYYQMKNTADSYVQLICVEEKSPQLHGDRLFHNVVKLLICLGEGIRKQAGVREVGEKLIYKILLRLSRPFIDWRSASSTNIMKRLGIFIDLMKNATIERKLYQGIMMDNWQQVQQCMGIFGASKEPSSLRYASFEQVVEESMIGQHSDMLRVKALIGSMMRQSLLTVSRKQYFRRVLVKLRGVVSFCNSNEYLLQWVEQQLQALSERQQVVISKLKEWMDLEDE